MNGGKKRMAADVAITQVERLSNQYEKVAVETNMVHSRSGTISVRPTSRSAMDSWTESN